MNQTTCGTLGIASCSTHCTCFHVASTFALMTAHDCICCMQNLVEVFQGLVEVFQGLVEVFGGLVDVFQGLVEVFGGLVEEHVCLVGLMGVLSHYSSWCSRECMNSSELGAF